MKNVKISVLGLMIALGFIACKKNTVTNTPGLSASKTNSIKINEPVLFTLTQASRSTVNWTVAPSTNTHINASGNQASIIFGAKGSYIVTAVSGNITATNTVSVVDTTITGGGGGTATILPFSTGEQINITASRLDSVSTSGIIFSATTTNSYTCISNSLVSNFTSGTNSYAISYTGVLVPYGCTTGTAKAVAFTDMYPVSTGTNTLTINFNGTTYTGTIVKTGNSYSINWPYTTGVTITPTSL